MAYSNSKFVLDHHIWNLFSLRKSRAHIFSRTFRLRVIRTIWTSKTQQLLVSDHNHPTGVINLTFWNFALRPNIRLHSMDDILE